MAPTDGARRFKMLLGDFFIGFARTFGAALALFPAFLPGGIVAVGARGPAAAFAAILTAATITTAVASAAASSWLAFSGPGNPGHPGNRFLRRAAVGIGAPVHQAHGLPFRLVVGVVRGGQGLELICFGPFTLMHPITLGRAAIEHERRRVYDPSGSQRCSSCPVQTPQNPLGAAATFARRNCILGKLAPSMAFNTLDLYRLSTVNQ